MGTSFFDSLAGVAAEGDAGVGSGLSAFRGSFSSSEGTVENLSQLGLVDSQTIKAIANNTAREAIQGVLGSRRFEGITGGLESTTRALGASFETFGLAGEMVVAGVTDSNGIFVSEDLLVKRVKLTASSSYIS